MLTSSSRRKQILLQKDLPNISKQESHTNYIRRRWNENEDSLLGHYVSLYGTKWLLVSEKMNGRSASQCSQRWKRLKSNYDTEVGIVRKRWTLKEDQLLLSLYKKHGPKWKKISKFIPTKDRRSVRNRYTNVLDPTLSRDQMTEEEDLQICKLYEAYGSKWRTISQYMPTRSENQIKNRFYCLLKPKYFSQPNLYYIKNPKELRQQILQKEFVNFNSTQINENQSDINQGFEPNSSFNFEEEMNDQDSCLLKEYDSNPCFLKVK